MQNRRHWFTVLFFLTTVISSFAYTVSGSVIDTSGEPLPEATVRILSARDSSYVKGGAANIDGVFNLAGVNSGKYLLECSYIGFNKTYVAITVKNANLKVDPVTLTETSFMLKDAVVTAVKTPIKVMEDTVEFNADSYKTQPNAVVEDLLKRLPGVEVDTDGSITHNGKTISKILVDGKEFFADDPQVGSKNLPVNIIDKLQVVDRKSDLARLTGVDDGEEETVINLTIKKGMNNGWFGNVIAGYGTDSRYQESFMVNYFKNGNQFTLLGGANNINEPAAGDNNGGRFRRFGGRSGITTTQALGTNFNVGNEEIFRVGGSVMYTHNKNNVRQRQERMYQFPDSFPTMSSTSRSIDRGHNLRGDFRLQWNADSFNVIEFRPNFSYNVNDSEKDELSVNRAGNALRDSVARSINRAGSHGKSFEFGGNFIYNHKFRSKPGRSFSVFVRYNLSNVRENENSYSWNKFFLLDSLYLYDQYLDNHTWSNNVSSRISWTEPLGNPKNGNYLTFAYNVNYRWNNSDKDVYDHPVDYTDPLNPVVDMDRLLFNDTLSNRFRNDFFSQDIRVGYKKVSKDFNFEGGISLVPSMSKSDDVLNDLRSIPERWVWNVAPFVRFKYKMSKTRSADFNYMGRSSQPSMTQLQPVPDYTDPMRVVVGNPGLAPSFSHNIRFRFSDFNQEAQRSIMIAGDANMTQNSIVSKTTYDRETSAQTTTYENVNGVWGANVFSMLSLPFKRRTWSFVNNMFFRFNQQVGFNDGLRNTRRELNFSIRPGISFKPDYLELTLRPRYSVQHTMSSAVRNTNGDNTIHTYGGNFDGTYNAPCGISLSTDLSYSATEGYSAGFNTRTWMWNATIAYQFLRNRQATIAVRAYDLLQQKSNIRRTISANYTDDIEYNDLTRYFMFTFTYKFNTFGKGNEPKSRDDRRFGPGGPGGPGRRPY